MFLDPKEALARLRDPRNLTRDNGGPSAETPAPTPAPVVPIDPTVKPSETSGALSVDEEGWYRPTPPAEIVEHRPVHNGHMGGSGHHINPITAPRIPQLLRPIIGIAANLDSVQNVASAFGISVDRTQELKNGERTNDVVDVHLREQIQSGVDKARSKVTDANDLAVEMLIQAMNHAKEKGLGDMSAKEAVHLGATLAVIHDKTKDHREVERGTKFFVYRPQQLSAEAFGVVEVTEKVSR